MKGIQYAIDLVDRTFGATIKKAKENTKGLDRAVKKVRSHLNKMGKSGKKNFNDISRYAKRAGKVMVAAFALNSVVAFGNEITNVAAKFEGYENAIRFASGQEGGENIKFVNDMVKKLNTDLEASYQGFQTISGALRGTSLEGQGARDIFEGMSIAATSMNLSGENLNGALVAFGQIASKGKVQAEELRGQLGERIPGAFNIASKAMGVSQVQLNKMLEMGQVYAEDFLPKFAAQLKKDFSGGLAAAANSMQASINKKNNAITMFKRNSADFLRPLLVGANEGIVKVLGYIESLLPRLEPLKTSIYNLFASLQPLTDALKGLGGSMGGAQGMIDGLKKAIDTLAVVIEILALGLGTIIKWLQPVLPLLAAVAAGWWAVNVAMYANPIGLVIAAIVALVGVVTYAWQKVGWFRGGIMAAWTAIKGFGKAIKEAVVNRFKEMLQGISGVGKAIKLIFEGDWKKAFEVGKKAADNLMGKESGQKFVADMKGVGKDAANAYNKGMAEAEANKGKGLKGLIPSMSANDKLLSGSGTGKDGKKTKVPGSGTGAGTTLSGGGTSTRHTTFNINSMVQNLTVQTTNINGDPTDLKRKLEQIFLELTADLEIRANG